LVKRKALGDGNRPLRKIGSRGPNDVEAKGVPTELISAPSNTSLPVFVYGFLKPGELAYSIVEAFVEKSIRANVRGMLRIRDGLPLLTAGNGTVDGYLLYPKGGLYKAICRFEPRAQYRWNTIETRERTLANVLLGRSPNKGSASLEAERFSSLDDILLADGPRAVRRTLRRAHRGDEVDRFFEVQMAYLLLWSIVERFMSLRYGPWLEPHDKIEKFGSDNLWSSALASIAGGIEQGALVVDSRDPDDVYRLDVTKPLGSLRYFYQFRCNIVHRGKDAMVETIRLKRAAMQLMDCTKAVWKEVGIIWTGDDFEELLPHFT
jgi:hypothetical protein